MNPAGHKRTNAQGKLRNNNAANSDELENEENITEDDDREIAGA